MAPNKKKKKPASNPARGFATTSLVSKKSEKATQDEEINLLEPPSIAAGDKGVPSSDEFKAAGSNASTDYSKLSPEEVEKRLEQAALVSLFEKFAHKVRRDSDRQSSRLSTDRRVLRNTEVLPLEKWLSLEIVEEILELARLEEHQARVCESTLNGKQISEEDTIVRLWTLHQTLVKAGITQEKLQDVLNHVMRTKVTSPRSNEDKQKDALWGIDEALDWLGANCPREDLPDYEHRRRPKTNGHMTESINGSSISPIEAPSPAGSGDHRDRPSHNMNDPSSEVRASYRDQPGSNQDDGSSRDATGHESSSGSDHDSIELDSDTEPEELLSTYLALKSRLYRRELAVPKSTKISPRTRRLLDCLARVETDILFDRKDAISKWREMKIDMDRQASSRRKLGLDATHRSGVKHDDGRTSPTNNTPNLTKNIPGPPSGMPDRIKESSGSEEEGDEDGLIGGLFGNDDVTSDPITSTTPKQSTAADVAVRDFGRWTGTSPRRILEDACRAKDSGTRFSCDVVSKTSFMIRCKLTVKWSKDQESFTSPLGPSITLLSTSRTVSATMNTISTPDYLQSEAYISTAMLFLVFGCGREDKVYLRLPSTWRDLWMSFAAIWQQQIDERDQSVIRDIRDMVHDQMDRIEGGGVVINPDLREGVVKTDIPISAKHDETANIPGLLPISDAKFLQDLWHRKSTTTKYTSLLRSRMTLPIWTFKSEVLRAIEADQVLIICGETGCGKSTQVPSFILEEELAKGRLPKIYVTEPRRISAISLARRVSEELGELKSDLGTARSLVGFSIRLEAKVSRDTMLVYATTGIVLRMLESSNELAEITHLILDEVHERSIDSDFLLMILRQLRDRRPKLKIILMSATVNAQRFSAYLGGAPILTVPGRTFPVETRYLEDAIELTKHDPDRASDGRGHYSANDPDTDLDDSTDHANEKSPTGDLVGYSGRTRSVVKNLNEYKIDYDLIVKLIDLMATSQEFLDFSKAILVFLPGLAEIRRLNDILSGNPKLSAGWYIYPLHSTIASEEQERAFLIPPQGFRKIVLATNIAETGITIPDVTCVIDAGKHKEMRFDERRQLSRLIESFISRANAKQRRGRAGRVQNGLCFHLFTKHRYENRMAEQQTPEMLRLSLQDLVLRVKICRLGGIEESLSEAMDPPSAKNIRRAIDALTDVKALTAAEELTPLGRQLAKLPLDVHLGKLLLLGVTFRCLDAAATIAAILSSKSPFSAPLSERKQAELARLSFARGDSDLLTLWNAYQAWRRVRTTTSSFEYQFCRKNFLNPQALSNIEDLKLQLLSALVDGGCLQLSRIELSSLQSARATSRQRRFFSIPSHYDSNSDDDLILGSVIAWSFYPKLLVRDGKGWRNVGNNQQISLHPASVNKSNRQIRWLSFYHVMQSSNKLYNAHETTAAEEFAIALLCGEAEIKLFAGVMILDGNRVRLSFADWKSLLALKILRARLKALLDQTFRSPGRALSQRHLDWFGVWERIFHQRGQRKREAIKQV
ncbi:MAG: hypothetical protein M1825_003579 [Sarcosagium campestre]|nr:MAG: hypothetical protein M1825_003579 [Sarcosagium campestre]